MKSARLFCTLAAACFCMLIASGCIQINSSDAGSMNIAPETIGPVDNYRPQHKVNNTKVAAESSISMDKSMDMIFENRFIKKLPSKYSALPPIPYYIALTSFSTHKSWRCREKPEI